MENTTQDLLDQFATAALNALINKMPFYDTKGDHGKLVSPKELQEIKMELTETAYEYAEYMMISREKARKWLSENPELKK